MNVLFNFMLTVSFVIDLINFTNSQDVNVLVMGMTTVTCAESGSAAPKGMIVTGHASGVRSISNYLFQEHII